MVFSADQKGNLPLQKGKEATNYKFNGEEAKMQQVYQRKMLDQQPKPSSQTSLSETRQPNKCNKKMKKNLLIGSSKDENQSQEEA